MKYLIIVGTLLSILTSCSPISENDPGTIADPLPSWNDGQSKSAILEFIRESTDPAGENFISEPDRIAVFDNDGTLWSEQPVYFQFFFAMDRIREMAREHPEWNELQPFKAVLENDMETLKGSGVNGLLTLTLASHSGMNTTEFESTVRNWINTAKHPVSGKLYKEMVYQPMLELLQFFRANGFKTYIVSGGGIDFMRPWTEEIYGIPPNQVIGSYGKYEFTESGGGFEIVKLPEIDFIDDKEGKPVAIHRFIGKKPVAAFGNSDGDLAMLQWTGEGKGKTLQVYIHHTDSIREWSYDRDSHIGHLEKGLEVASEKGWLIVDMQKDWDKIYPSN